MCRDAELSLLLSVCFGGSDRTAIDRRLTQGVDWTRLIRLNLHHRTTALLLPALGAADLSLVPSNLLHALGEYANVLARQQRKVTEELFALLDACAACAIPVVPFKGPLLGWRLYGGLGQRPPGDLDLLFHYRDVEHVREILERRGYKDMGQRLGVPALTGTQRRMYERFQCEYTYAHAELAAVVEPHWQLSPRLLAIDLDYEQMLDAAVRVDVNGREVLMLADRDLALALAVHGAKHRWSRVTWIRDFAALLRLLDPDDLATIYATARRRGCGRIWLLGLSVARACTPLQLPAIIDRALEADSTLPSLCDEVVVGLAHPEWPEPGNERVDRFRYRSRENWADRARYAIRTWVTPRRHHLESVELKPGFEWAYYAIKIGADIAYMWR